MKLFSRVLLPLLLLIYIAIETYLKLNHSSLCEAIGCKLAGELLRFDPIYLNYLGLSSILSLVIVGFLSLNKTFFEKLFFTILYGAIAFEATILGYQFFVNPEPCIFCMGIFSSLLLIALLAQGKNFILIGTVALSIFIGLSTLAFSKNASFVTQNGVYLIHSKGCSHCVKVKSYFKEHHIDYTPISVREASARSFLKFAGITSIPVLLSKDDTGISMLVGDHKIITHYEAQNKVIAVPLTNPTPTSNTGQSTAGLPMDLFKATSEPGCAVSIIETTDCDKNTTTR
jgi:glutaredoxin